MKRIIILFISVLIIYFFLKFVLHDFVFGHDIDYSIKEGKNTFEVKEVLNLKKDQDINNYYFEITKKNTKFVFKTDYNFKKDMKIIEKIKYFKNDNYECLLPVFKDKKTPLDMMCYYKNQLYFNYNLPKKDSELNKFVKSIDQLYDYKKWSDKKTDTKKKASITVYKSNILDNHYIVLDNYRGIYTIAKDNELTNIKLFEEDVYETQIKSLVDKKYIIANYNESHDFNKFYTVDITNGKKDEFIVNYDISFDSYINGNYKDSLFLLDKEAKIQYEINQKRKEAYIVGDKKSGILIYNNGKETNVKMNDAIKKEYKFDNSKNDDNYERIDLIGGYYYLFSLDEKEYNVYKAPKENRKEKIYLFSTDNLDDIYYVDNYIYFRNGNDVLYYQDSLGVKTLFNNSEYEFNKNLEYYVYIEE